MPKNCYKIAFVHELRQHINQCNNNTTIDSIEKIIDDDTEDEELIKNRMNSDESNDSYDSMEFEMAITASLST